MEPEKEALEAYKEAGVELPPEAEPKPEPEEPEAPEPEKVEEPEKEPEAEEESEPDTDEPLQPEPQTPPKKRSIYQDLKEKKQEAKTERELREQAERERDDLKLKLEEAGQTPAEAKKTSEDLESFAKEIGADPSALNRMRELFLKDLPKNELPEEMASQLKEFQEWQKSNSEAMEQVAFEKEFETTLPTISKMFPKASAEETKAIKTKLQELAHTEAYHDKELDYIAFKNQEALSALVSPKKRGLEPKGKGDAPQADNFTFDPTADISKMSPKEAEAWEKEYQKATSSDSLHTDAEGRKIII